MTYKTGTIGDFMRWTKRIIAHPDVAKGKPRRWFDSDQTAKKALSRTSPEAMLKLLSPENLELLHLIGSRRPDSVHALAELVGRNQSNLSRTLKKLQEVGMVGFEDGPNRTRAPRLLAQRFTLDLDLMGKNSAVSVEHPQVRLAKF